MKQWSSLEEESRWGQEEGGSVSMISKRRKRRELESRLWRWREFEYSSRVVWEEFIEEEGKEREMVTSPVSFVYFIPLF